MYTGKTPNYELPQYEAEDKPTYLGDFNEAMLKVDTNMKTIDSKATEAQTVSSNANSAASEALETAQSASSQIATASQNASQALTTAQNAQTDATTAISTANTASGNASQAKTTAESAQQTANQANSTATTAKNTADANAQQISKITWDSLGDIKTNGTGSLNAYFNEGLNLLNIYGRTNGLSGTGTNVKIASLPENVRPTATRRINGVAFTYYGTGSNQDVTLFDLDILPNGDVVIPDNVAETIYSLRINCMLNTSGWFD